jgi:hypothetical protein
MAVAIAPALVTTILSALNPVEIILVQPSGFNLAVLAFLAAAVPCTAGALAAVGVGQAARLISERVANQRT